MLIVVGVLAWQLYANEQSRPSQRVTAESAKSELEALQLQKLCADEAEKRWHAGWPNPTAIDSYESHYDTQLRKCFMSTYSRVGETVDEELFDAFGGTVYGEFLHDNMAGTRYCRLMDPTKSEQPCKSE
ncbi:MAG: hypothetical protein WAW96_02400, partial [Alphaproteobacteria bacterium]